MRTNNNRQIVIEVIERHTYTVTDPTVADDIRQALKDGDTERLDELTSYLADDHTANAIDEIVKVAEVKPVATKTTNRGTCDCCGTKRRVLTQGRFTVGGRVFEGWICRTCGTCETCGTPIVIDDAGQPTCGGTTPACQAFNGAEVTK